MPLLPTQCCRTLSEKTESWSTKLSQVLVNNIDDWGKGISLRIYVRYSRFILLVKFFKEKAENNLNGMTLLTS